MKIDREVQNKLLQRLADEYPQPVEALELGRGIDPQLLDPTIAYLEEHGLVRATFIGSLNMGNPLLEAKITARGIDFLADDGGLGAILAVVTVKMHEDTLKQLIASKLEAADLPPQDKKRFLDQLRELPGETTKHLALKLVDVGLENWHKALPLIQSMIGPG
ncbi:hypothetical protein [Stenotrophomonas maltophilia]|uniref:hypothetical protein n=1 Tax=Stenotrophomonas maltophilia TaxID=40324 RepID=UPI0021C9A6BF|nr:hypothetical protein [Stenotrophomonas maltophilia]MCU1201817.1 hypothetical protein [Stenotrophomonas maltophilia]